LLNGAVNPSASLVDSTATLRAGDLFAGSSATFEFRLNGVAPGTQYDQIAITGEVHLSGAAMRITNGFAPPPGATFVIISNDGADAVDGSFFGLPEGSFITTNGVSLQISYAGGDGNDVTLTRPFTPTGVTRVWDGGGVGNLWSTPANWVGDVAPQQGDNVDFPPNVPKDNVVFDAGTNAWAQPALVRGFARRVSRRRGDRRGAHLAREQPDLANRRAGRFADRRVAD
jgi:hypothetical protein